LIVFPGNMKNMSKMLKQAQQAQERMQQEIAALRAEGTAGGGAVSATVDGKKNLVALVIAPDVLDDKDPQMLADLVLAAVADAARKVDGEIETRMGGFAQSLGLPPGLGF
jgi:DNA-binding YbaB/EbfC family protein